MRNNPKISIVIPTYNSGKLLLRAIRSVLSQSFTDYEIIIVDDGSEDNTQDLVKVLKLDKLYYSYLEHNNANVARNHGILQSKGKYIAMLDSDDEWHKHHLEINMQLIKNNDCDGIYSGVVMKTPFNESIFKARPLIKDEKMINYLLSNGIGAHTSTLFMNANAVKNIHWDESLKRHQDYDFVIRFAEKYRWLANRDITAIYHANQKQNKGIDFQSCIRFINKYKKDILPEVYNSYHSTMLNIAISMGANDKIIKYYLRNSVKYPSYISQKK